MKGILKEEDLEQICKASFKNAIKLQIGCAVEPTLFKHNQKLIEIAVRYRVPHISMVTNGNLLTKEDVSNYVNSGLNEFIISVHGVTRKTYENFMEKGSFDLFHQTLAIITEQKKVNPKLLLRINYTFNEDNFHELTGLLNSYNNYSIDVIQLRAIDKVGDDTIYANYSLQKIENSYLNVCNQIKNESEKRGITFIFPSTIFRNISQVSTLKSTNNSSYLEPYVFCYISPRFYWQEDFDYKNETLIAWKNRVGWNKKLFKNIFISKKLLVSRDRNILNSSVIIN